METWVMATCRKKYTRRLVFWGLLAFAALLFAALNYRYVVNFVGGPFPMTEEELASLGDPAAAPHYFVRVEGQEVVETGVQEITTTTRNGVEEGRSVTAEYIALTVGQHLLIVRAEAKSKSQEGSIRPMDSELRKELQLDPSDTGVLPFYLDTASFRTEGYWALAVYVGLLALILGFGIPAWRRLNDIASDPVVKRVAGWGDPIGIAHEIERQYTQMVWIRRLNVALTPDYIVNDAFFTFDVLRFDDLLWAYMKVIKKSVNFIPAGKDYQAVFVCYGGTMTLQASESQVLDVVKRCAERAPWAAIGFTPEIEQYYTKRTQEFCQAIEARKKELRDNRGPGAPRT